MNEKNSIVAKRMEFIRLMSAVERKTHLNKLANRRQICNSEFSRNEIKHPLKNSGNSLLQAQLNLFRKTLAKGVFVTRATREFHN